jgi:hypothetical protein
MTTDDLRAPSACQAQSPTAVTRRSAGLYSARHGQPGPACVPVPEPAIPAGSSITGGCEESPWAALYELPVAGLPQARGSAYQLPSRAAQPAGGGWPQPHVSPCRDFTTLTRVLAGLNRLAD